MRNTMLNSRKRLTHLTLSVIVSAVMQASHANGFPMYVGIQAGYTYTNENQLPSSDVTPDFTTVANTMPGSTLHASGGDLTITSIHVNSVDINSFRNKTKDQVFSERLFVGGQFYSNLALEVGYTHMDSVSLSYDARVSANTTMTFNNNPTSIPETLTVNTDNRKDTIQLDGIDLVFKGLLPLDYGFILYGKAGGMWLYNRRQTDITISGINQITFAGNTQTINPPAAYTITTKQSGGNIYPTISAGMDYYVTPDIGIEFNLTRIVGNSTSSGSNMDFISLGVLHTFMT